MERQEHFESRTVGLAKENGKDTENEVGVLFLPKSLVGMSVP